MKTKPLTDNARAALKNLRDHGNILHGKSGRSEHGGAAATRTALIKRGLAEFDVGGDLVITQAGRDYLSPPVPEDFTGPDSEPITMIIWHKIEGRWDPHAVFTQTKYGGYSCHDFDRCQALDQIYHHESGGGGGGPYAGRYTRPAKGRPDVRMWLRPGIVARIGDGSIEDKRTATVADEEAIAEAGFELVREVPANPFDTAYEGDLEWCTICQDRFPYDDQCRHLSDGIDTDGGGCGQEDRDLVDAENEFMQLFQALNHEQRKLVRERVQAMNAGTRTLLIDRDDIEGDWQEEHRADTRLDPAAAWLMSLDHKAKGPVALTAGWIYKFDRQTHRGRHVLPSTTIYQRVPASFMARLKALPNGPVEDRSLMFLKRWPCKKDRCMNDFAFSQDPTAMRCVWLKRGGDHIILTVAECQVSKKLGRAGYRFGRVLQGGCVRHKHWCGHRTASCNCGAEPNGEEDGDE